MSSYHLHPPSGAAIPRDAISYSDALQAFFRLVSLDPIALMAEVERSDAYRANSGWFGPEKVDPAFVGDNERMKEMGKAELVFRDCLARGEYIPLIRDPGSGEVLQTSPREAWAWPSVSGSFAPTGVSAGQDYVWPDDTLQPGPNTAIGGKAQPVFFMRAHFETELAQRAIRMGIAVIDEQPRQIEHSGHPGDHRDHAECLEPEIESARAPEQKHPDQSPNELDSWPEWPKTQPSGRISTTYWLIANRLWGALGPPSSLSVREITQRISDEVRDPAGKPADKTIERLLKGQ